MSVLITDVLPTHDLKLDLTGLTRACSAIGAYRQVTAAAICAGRHIGVPLPSAQIDGSPDE
jgi:hypothetical protein